MACQRWRQESCGLRRSRRRTTRARCSSALANERDEFYLYSLMRLVPLRDAAVRLKRLPRSPDGLDGLRVTCLDRPDVDLLFDTRGRLRRLTVGVLLSLDRGR